MSVKVFRQREDVGIHVRQRGQLISTTFVSEKEAKSLRDKLIELFPPAGWIQTKSLTLTLGEQKPREWQSWTEVPEGVRVEALGPAGTNPSGTHDIWRKDGSSVTLWWAKALGHSEPKTYTNFDEPYSLAAPFREVPPTDKERLQKLLDYHRQLTAETQKRLAQLNRRQWEKFEDVPIGVWVDNTHPNGTMQDGTNKHDRYLKATEDRFVVEWAADKTEVLTPDKFWSFPPLGPFVEVVDG